MPEISLIFSFTESMNGGLFIHAFLESPYFLEKVTEAVNTLPKLNGIEPFKYEGVSFSEFPSEKHVADCFVSHMFCFIRRLLMSRWEGGGM